MNTLKEIPTPWADEVSEQILDSSIPMGMKFGRMADFGRQLERRLSHVIAEVLIWWEEHQNDTYDGGERNVYREPPDFVKAAMEIAMAKPTQ